MPPGASFAYLTRIAGGATPAEALLAWTFPDSGAFHVDLLCELRGYAGGGLTFALKWSSLATSNNAVWQVAIRRFQDDAEDLDSTAHSYDYNTVTAAAPSAVQEISYDSVTFTDGADMDSWADGELAIVRVKRDGAHASDNLANTAYLWSVTGRET